MLLREGNGIEAAITEKLGNEDNVSGLSNVETDAESEDEGKKKGDSLKENGVKEDKTEIENKELGEVGE